MFYKIYNFIRWNIDFRRWKKALNNGKEGEDFIKTVYYEKFKVIDAKNTIRQQPLSNIETSDNGKRCRILQN